MRKISTIMQALGHLDFRITWQGYIAIRVFLCDECFKLFEPHIQDDVFQIEWKAGGGGPAYLLGGQYKGGDVPESRECSCCKAHIDIGEEISIVVAEARK